MARGSALTTRNGGPPLRRGPPTIPLRRGPPTIPLRHGPPTTPLRRRGTMIRQLAALVAIARLCAGCQTRTLPPLAELLVQVDTDAPVPLTVNRLRIDLFNESGAWFDTRDVSLDSANDWPASFSVYSSAAMQHAAVARLRAYTEGSLRDYCPGCALSASEDLPFDPRPTPASLAELCAGAPHLAWGGRITQRRGAYPILGGGSQPALSGSVAARVTVAVAGPHHFEAQTLRSNTGNNLPLEAPRVNLTLRRDCQDENTELGVGTPDGAPIVVDTSPLNVDLEPGDYTLLTGGDSALEPADVTLAATSAVEPILETVTDASMVDASAPGSTEIDLIMTDRSRTPTTEPLDSATIDRLVLLQTTRDQKRITQVMLAGDCFGIKAQLAVNNGLLQASQSFSCIDSSRQLVPLTVETTVSLVAPAQALSKVGSWGRPDGCSNQPPAGAICVGGGAFVLGGPDFAGFGVSSSMPERVLKVSPFFFDRNEVTVAQYRAATAAGFSSLDSLGDCADFLNSLGDESLAAACISWFTARAYCKFVGGELPTEAEWEYAATLAGRTTKTLYPWGDEPPDCNRAVFGREQDMLSGGTECQDAGLGAANVDAGDHPGGDVTPQGIVGLGGGVAEWVLDAAHSFAGLCWAESGLTDPVCWEEQAVLRSQRGHGWTDPADALRATSRRRRPPREMDVGVGFRCAYKDVAP